MNYYELDKEKQQILADLEAGNYGQDPDMENAKKRAISGWVIVAVEDEVILYGSHSFGLAGAPKGRYEHDSCGLLEQ